MLYRCFALFLLVARAWASNASSGGSGGSSCKCVDPVALGAVTATEGKVTFTSGKTSSVASVDASYGSSCKAWDTEAGSEYYSECTIDNATWCTTAWCYVDMCNCDQADMGGSSYFTVSTKLKLGYSYKTCESSATTAATDYLTTYCTAQAASNCTKLSCKDSSGTCVPRTSAEITAAAGCGGKPGCSCIDPVGLGCVTKASDKVTFNGPTSGNCEVPKQYGTGCAAWDTAEGMEFYSECKTDDKTWCKDPWCYIDMCNCDAADSAAASYFVATDSLKLGYSYTTCDGTATSTADYLTTFCSDKTEDECGETTVCKVDSGSCTKKTSTEIKDGLGCPTPATATASCTGDAPAAPTCAAGNNSATDSTAPAPADSSTTTSACYRQRFPAIMAVVSAVTTFVLM